ncbi:hypothetical protein [Amphibacillus jilinensis]|uniref:hypothetical protein n=1 Tax=Amphibacillus jilinensis TaxID=1216008 RepID=UPI0002F00E5F|nr:hypothetical protein [Amphibacillus jilinensis]
MRNELNLMLDFFEDVAGESGEFKIGKKLVSEYHAKDYINKAKELEGIGKIKIYSCWYKGKDLDVTGKVL